jgi:anhydro-N-acetylmuramic acid kinase
MKKVIDLINKEKKLIIGALSGTSVDAVDVVLAEVNGSGTDTKVNVLYFDSLPISPEFKEFVLVNSDNSTASLRNISQLNFLIGNLFADSILDFLKKNNISADKIDVIGSHGQTIHHVPKPEDLFGYDIKSTLQIGDPSVIANMTGIITVGDFRTADMALGGEGAPLVPYLDYILFRSNTADRLLVNIGGISNISYIPMDGDMSAFDTGPGNMVIDRLMKEFYGKPFDENGEVAAVGRLNEKLFDNLKKFDNYYNASPPKSTGREFYGESFIDYILSVAHDVSDEDIIRTVTDYTAFTIYYNVKKFIGKTPEEILVSGGGAKNRFLMGLLKEYFGVEVKPLEQNGITPDNKEAVLFAVLANETINGNPSNVPAVSGAERPAILGKICLV